VERERSTWRVSWQDGPNREALMGRAAALGGYRVGRYRVEDLPLPAAIPRWRSRWRGWRGGAPSPRQLPGRRSRRSKRSVRTPDETRRWRQRWVCVVQEQLSPCAVTNLPTRPASSTGRRPPAEPGHGSVLARFVVAVMTPTNHRTAHPRGAAGGGGAGPAAAATPVGSPRHRRGRCGHDGVARRKWHQRDLPEGSDGAAR